MWILIYVHISSWDGKIDQRLEIGKYKDRAYCEQAVDGLRKNSFDHSYYVCADEVSVAPISNDTPLNR